MISLFDFLAFWLRAILLPYYFFSPFLSQSIKDSEDSEKRDDKHVAELPLTFNFPDKFILRDLVAISAPVFELKTNPLQDKANESMRNWFLTFNLYSPKKLDKFLNHGKFDLFAGLTFPHADQFHLETCLAFYFWAFSTDDYSDEGQFQKQPDDVQAGHEVSNAILFDPHAPRPRFPYAAMLYDILARIRSTATVGTYNRFAKAFLLWSRGQVKQAHNRQIERMPSSDEFIIMRRATIGGAMVEAMVEYSLDLDIPNYVFEHPTIKAMSDATTDIMTWPNDLCSFNKEQADGDYQNLVCILMVERNLDLQGAVDLLTDMLAQRIQDYVHLKSTLPSWGPDVDGSLAIYLKNLEHFVQGTILWYYSVPRYFRNIDTTNRENLVIPLFPPSDD